MSTDSYSAGRRFAQWLLKKRKERGLTQGHVAEAAGVSRAYIAMIEGAGRGGFPRLPTREVVERLARGLEASVNEALLAAGYTPPESARTPTVERIAAEAAELPEPLQQVVLDVIASLKRCYRRGTVTLEVEVDDEGEKAKVKDKRANKRA